MSALWSQVLIPLSTSGSKVEENSHLPDYLPEEESPEKELDRAVSRTGAKQDTGGSWLNTAASFLTKTFYWWSLTFTDCSCLSLDLNFERKIGLKKAVCTN